MSPNPLFSVPGSPSQFQGSIFTAEWEDKQPCNRTGRGWRLRNELTVWSLLTSPFPHEKSKQFGLMTSFSDWLKLLQKHKLYPLSWDPVEFFNPWTIWMEYLFIWDTRLIFLMMTLHLMYFLFHTYLSVFLTDCNVFVCLFFIYSEDFCHHPAHSQTGLKDVR